MKQILSITVLDYLKKIHNVTITCSNAIELLDTVKQFEQLHLSHKNDFKTFRGLNFETILEVIQQDIHRIEQSHKLYRVKGNLITINTKQYTIEQKNKEYDKENSTKEIAKEVYNELFINNVKSKKEKKAVDLDDYLRDLDLIKRSKM